MRLNKQGKEKIRTILCEQLKVVPTEKRVKLDKHLLEQLLFEERTDKKSGKKVKFLVFSGQFLRKIDLSEVSFDDVFWGFNPIESYDNFSMVQPIRDMYDVNHGCQFYIDLSETNAKIDFSKSYDYAIGNKKISHLDLSFVDLSKSNIDYFITMEYVNIQRTQAKLNPEIEASHCDFSENDLSFISASPASLTSTNKKPYFYDTILKKTSLKIESKEKLKKYEKIGIGRLIKVGFLEGCYLNGKKIKSVEEIKEITQRKYNDYQNYIQMCIKNIEVEVQKVKKQQI